MGTRTMDFVKSMEKWASEVTEALVVENQKPSDTVTKIAKEHDLNPDQVARLCELSNHQIYAQMFKKGDERVYDFPTADARMVILAMRHSPTEKEAMDLSLADYQKEAFDLHVADQRLLNAIFSDLFPKTAEEITIPYVNDISPERQALILEINKTAAALSDIQTDEVSTQIGLSEKEQEIYQKARQIILKGGKVGDLVAYIDQEVGGSSRLSDTILDKLKAENIIDARLDIDDSDGRVRHTNKDRSLNDSIESFKTTEANLRILRRASAKVQEDLTQMHIELDKIGGPIVSVERFLRRKGRPS